MIYTVTLNPTLDRSFHVSEIVFNEMMRASTVKVDISGKGLNVSLALKELGCFSTATGFLGGATGRRLEEGLQAQGIGCDFVHISGETRSNVVIYEEPTQRYVKANEPGPEITPEEKQQFIDKLSRLAAPDDVWVFSGSLPPGLPTDFYAHLIRMVQAKGGRACFDSSGDMLRLGMEANPWLVKPNLLEAQQASGLPVEDEAGAQRAVEFFLQKGAHIVALSMGEAGLMLSDGREVTRIRPPSIAARNPTAAGDALMAGLIYALQQGQPLKEAGCWGVACGAAAAMQDGSGIGPRALVLQLLDQIPS